MPVPFILAGRAATFVMSAHVAVGDAIYVVAECGHYDRALIHSIQGDGTITAHVCATGERLSGLRHRDELRGAHCDDACWIRADEG